MKKKQKAAVKKKSSHPAKPKPKTKSVKAGKPGAARKAAPPKKAAKAKVKPLPAKTLTLKKKATPAKAVKPKKSMPAAPKPAPAKTKKIAKPAPLKAAVSGPALKTLPVPTPAAQAPATPAAKAVTPAPAVKDLKKKPLTDKKRSKIIERIKHDLAEQERHKQPELPLSRKKKYSLEFTIKSSPHVLYEFVSEPSELAEWFADEVHSHGTHFSFSWDGERKEAEMIDYAEEEFARYKWADAHAGEYFEFRIGQSEITNDTILTITDFADEKDLKEMQELWDSQIHMLMKRIGMG